MKNKINNIIGIILVLFVAILFVLAFMQEPETRAEVNQIQEHKNLIDEYKAEWTMHESTKEELIAMQNLASANAEASRQAIILLCRQYADIEECIEMEELEGYLETKKKSL